MCVQTHYSDFRIKEFDFRSSPKEQSTIVMTDLGQGRNVFRNVNQVVHPIYCFPVHSLDNFHWRRF